MTDIAKPDGPSGKALDVDIVDEREELNSKKFPPTPGNILIVVGSILLGLLIVMPVLAFCVVVIGNCMVMAGRFADQLCRWMHII